MLLHWLPEDEGRTLVGSGKHVTGAAAAHLWRRGKPL